MALRAHRDKWLMFAGVCLFTGFAYSAFQLYSHWKSSKIITMPMPDCDLGQGPCFSRLDSGERVELRIKPTHMPVLTSVQLEVKTEKIPVKKISIFFKGVEMDMGEFHYALSRQREGLYSAQTILPTCIQDQMIWQAQVHIETNHKRYTAPFVLINHRPVGT